MNQAPVVGKAAFEVCGHCSSAGTVQGGHGGEDYGYISYIYGIYINDEIS